MFAILLFPFERIEPRNALLCAHLLLLALYIMITWQVTVKANRNPEITFEALSSETAAFS